MGQALQENRFRIFLMLLLIAGVFVVYGDSLHHSFLINWDDEKFVLKNEAVRGFSLAHLKTAFVSSYIGNYVPIQIISYMLDYEIWGLSAAGFIGTNLLLHALNGILFCRLLERLCRERLIAYGAAFIFLFHPVQVETVVWISQRKNLLAMTFFLVAMHCYYSYRENRRIGFYLGTLIALILALLSKSVAVIFPLVAVLLDICFKAKEERLRLLDKIPFLLASLAISYLTAINQAMPREGGALTYPGGSPLTTFYTMVPVLTEYLRDCFFPHNLSPYYMTLIRTVPDTTLLLATLVLLLLATMGMILYRKDKSLFFWYALFFVGLLPVMQIVPLLTLKSDRYLYFPLLGFAPFIMLSVRKSIGRLPKIRIAAWTAVILLLGALPMLSYRQSSIWQDSITLWSHAVRIDPTNQVGWRMLTIDYTKMGNGPAASQALAQYQRLLAENGPVRGWE